MAEHPTFFALESWQTGAPDPEVERHVAGCEACRAYVAGLEDGAAAFVAESDPTAFARDLRARAEMGSPTKAAAPAWRRWVWVGVPVAVAGALILVVALRSSAPRLSLPSFDRSEDPGPDIVRFKGDLQLAVRLLRDGRQTRHVERLVQRTGDRLRVELIVGEGATLSVVVVAGGKAQMLVGARHYDPGSVLLDSPLKVTGQPEPALIVAGTPEQVARFLERRPVVGLARFALEVPR